MINFCNSLPALQAVFYSGLGSDMKNVIIPTPTNAEVKRYNKELPENYLAQNNALKRLFRLMPKNKSLSAVLLKCATLNDFYSTNIFSIYPVAKHIQSLDIDERLKSGDISVVNDIQNVDGRKFYSFATKYCSHHNPEVFPIYDSFVVKVLMYFKKDEFSSFEEDDLRDYARFKQILLDFKNYYNLDCNLRELDLYLWLLGKRYFPKKYKNKNKS